MIAVKRKTKHRERECKAEPNKVPTFKLHWISFIILFALEESLASSPLSPTYTVSVFFIKWTHQRRETPFPFHHSNALNAAKITNVLCHERDMSLLDTNTSTQGKEQWLRKFIPISLPFCGYILLCVCEFGCVCDKILSKICTNWWKNPRNPYGCERPRFPFRRPNLKTCSPI